MFIIINAINQINLIELLMNKINLLVFNRKYQLESKFYKKYKNLLLLVVIILYHFLFEKIYIIYYFLSEINK